MHLKRSWDGRWSEVAPCEIVLFDDLSPSKVVTVYKEDFSGQTSSYDLDYWGQNKRLPSINNHVTPAYLAVSDGSSGLLIAQDRTKMHGFAAFPLRQSIIRETAHYDEPVGELLGRTIPLPIGQDGVGTDRRNDHGRAPLPERPPGPADGRRSPPHRPVPRKPPLQIAVQLCRILVKGGEIAMMKITKEDGGFILSHNGVELVQQRPVSPAFRVGTGTCAIRVKSGHYTIEDETLAWHDGSGPVAIAEQADALYITIGEDLVVEVTEVERWVRIAPTWRRRR